jgi:hypothetical protein
MQIKCECCSKTIVTMLATRSVESEGEIWDTHAKVADSLMLPSISKASGRGQIVKLLARCNRQDGSQGVEKCIQEHITDDQHQRKERYDKIRREAEVEDLREGQHKKKNKRM